MSLGDGSMMGSGTLGEELTVDITCKNPECEKEFPNEDVSTDDWGNYSFECPACGYTSEFEQAEYVPDGPDRMTGDGE